MMQLALPPNQVYSDMRYHGAVEIIIFHWFTLMCFFCYLRLVMVHPGKVPDEGWRCEPADQPEGQAPAEEPSSAEQPLQRMDEVGWLPRSGAAGEQWSLTITSLAGRAK